MTGGTGGRAQIGCPAGGKTGTTDRNTDAWFVGFTPRLATAVWVGYPNAQIEMTSVHGIQVAGGTFPATIWNLFMSSVFAGAPSSDWPLPTNPVEWVPFQGQYEYVPPPPPPPEKKKEKEKDKGKEGKEEDGEATTTTEEEPPPPPTTTTTTEEGSGGGDGA
jgi:penicillin-binding protein 1A